MNFGAKTIIGWAWNYDYRNALDIFKLLPITIFLFFEH